MLPGRAADVRQRLLQRLLLCALLLLLCARVNGAHSSTVEHDFHLVHNVDNRSPEIDPFWYVGRGVRPIGRFGKRRSVEVDIQPVFRTLQLLLNSLKFKDRLHKAHDWLP